MQLRCIELNGDWDRFVQHVHGRVRKRGIEDGVRVTIQQKQPAPLHEIKEAVTPGSICVDQGDVTVTITDVGYRLFL